MILVLWGIYAYLIIGFLFVIANIKTIPYLIESIMEIDEDEVFGEKDFDKIKGIVLILLILFWPRFIKSFPNQ
jgi:uncharacterized protein Smg (DUF494 family)